MTKICPLLFALLGTFACATVTPLERPQGPAREQVYQISVASVDGYPTADRGPAGYPACTIQVGTTVARVWLAHPATADVTSPVVMTGDATELKDGVLVERTWREAVVHQVTDDELASGMAVIYVPGVSRRHTVVELRFQPVPAPHSLRHQDHFPKNHPRLQRAMSGGDVR